MKEWFIDHLPESFVTLFASLIGWLAHRAITKVDRQEARIAALEKNSVTKDDIDELRESMVSSFSHGLERIERRTDQILFHMARDDK